MTDAPAPLPGADTRPTAYPLLGLAASAGVTPQTVRFYVAKGLLARPKLAGPSTRYGDDHFVRLQATVRLRRDQHLKLAAIRAWLAQATPEELVRAAGIALPAPPPVVEAAPAAPASPAPIDAASTSRVGPYRREVAEARERWERVSICPGVELHVRWDADPEALRVAREIEAAYAASRASQASLT